MNLKPETAANRSLDFDQESSSKTQLPAPSSEDELLRQLRNSTKNAYWSQVDNLLESVESLMEPTAPNMMSPATYSL